MKIFPQTCEFVEYPPKFHLEPPRIPKKPKSYLLKTIHPLGNLGETISRVTKMFPSDYGKSVNSINQLLNPRISSISTIKSPRKYSNNEKHTLNIYSEKLKQGYFMNLNDIKIKVPSIIGFDELIIQYIISTGTPSRTFSDKLVLKLFFN